MSYYTPRYEDVVTQQPQRFSPYSMNGGSVVAIAGEDYSIIGADTRLSLEYSIMSRNQEKLFKLSDGSVLGCTGCWGDALTLSKMLSIRMDMYRHEHNKVMPTCAISQMLATMLYYKRFFPYYVLNILAGLDDEGKGCVFSYDPVGHCERSNFRASGSAGSLLQPLLDNQVGMNNLTTSQGTPENFPKDKAIALVKDGFTSAAERDVYTGDSVQIITITKDGLKEEKFPLRRD